MSRIVPAHCFACSSRQCVILYQHIRGHKSCLAIIVSWKKEKEEKKKRELNSFCSSQSSSRVRRMWNKEKRRVKKCFCVCTIDKDSSACLSTLSRLQQPFISLFFLSLAGFDTRQNIAHTFVSITSFIHLLSVINIKKNGVKNEEKNGKLLQTVIGVWTWMNVVAVWTKNIE